MLFPFNKGRGRRGMPKQTLIVVVSKSLTFSTLLQLTNVTVR